MSTNFDWIITGPVPEPVLLPTAVEVEWRTVDSDDPRIHIGKQIVTSVNGIRGCAFIWAQDKSSVLMALTRNPRRSVVVDEYGRRYTGNAMKTILANMLYEDFDSIGKKFS